MSKTEDDPNNGTVKAESSVTNQHRDRTLFQYAVLTVLADEARYGLAIKRELEDFYGCAINHGRLYPNLDDLADEGLVEKRELDKRTNEYDLTDDGEVVVEDLHSWIDGRISNEAGA